MLAIPRNACPGSMPWLIAKNSGDEGFHHPLDLCGMVAVQLMAAARERSDLAGDDSCADGICVGVGERATCGRIRLKQQSGTADMR